MQRRKSQIHTHVYVVPWAGTQCLELIARLLARSKTLKRLKRFKTLKHSKTLKPLFKIFKTLKPLFTNSKNCFAQIFFQICFCLRFFSLMFFWIFFIKNFLHYFPKFVFPKTFFLTFLYKNCSEIFLSKNLCQNVFQNFLTKICFWFLSKIFFYFNFFLKN